MSAFREKFTFDRKPDAEATPGIWKKLPAVVKLRENQHNAEKKRKALVEFGIAILGILLSTFGSYLVNVARDSVSGLSDESIVSERFLD